MDWGGIYQRFTESVRWQNNFQNNSEIRFESVSANDIPTNVDLSGVTIDDLMDEPKRPQRVAREEPTLREVWAD